MVFFAVCSTAQNNSNNAFTAISGSYIPLAVGTVVAALMGDVVNSLSIPLGFTSYY
jgi:hypothetical protein